MQRRKKQAGTTVRIGGFWCVRHADWRIEDGVHVRKQGLTHKLTTVLDEHQRLKRPPEYVKKIQADFMETVNGSVENPDTCSTISQFVELTWLPTVKRDLSSSTLTTYRYYWDHLLKPLCGGELLRDYTTAQAEGVLTEIFHLHPGMRKATLNKLRSMLSAILKRAIGLGYRPEDRCR